MSVAQQHKMMTETAQQLAIKENRKVLFIANYKIDTKSHPAIFVAEFPKSIVSENYFLYVFSPKHQGH